MQCPVSNKTKSFSFYLVAEHIACTFKEIAFNYNIKKSSL